MARFAGGVRVFAAGPWIFTRSLIYDAGRLLCKRAPYAKIADADGSP